MLIGKRCGVIGCDKMAVAKGLCGTHYKRVARHGSTDAGRPSDWGDRFSHPLYSVWKSLSRLSTTEVCSEWKNDFWAFTKDIGGKPDTPVRLQRLVKENPYSPHNWFWLEIDTAREGADERERNNEKQKAYAKRMRSLNPGYFKNQDLKRKYGITLDEWQRMYDEQDGACKICGQPETKIDRRQGLTRSLSVDHCHETSKVRGLLCSDCNTAIGLFKHSELLLIKAIEYCKST